MERRNSYDNADIIVVGAGASGLTASVVAAQKGKKVTLIEKLNTIGGTGAYTEGVFAIGSKYQKAESVDIKIADILKKTQEFHHYLSNAALTKAYYEESANTIDWLESVGVKFAELRRFNDKCPKVWHIFDGLGEAMIKTMHQKAISLGVNIMTETHCKELITDGKRVIGVIVEKQDGVKITINADAVILATGGFANNNEMIKKYTPFDAENYIPIGSPGRTGDGINMGLDIGADIVGMSNVMLGEGMLRNTKFNSDIMLAGVIQPILKVNEKGKRFVSEDTLNNFPFWGNAMALQKEVYTVFDSATVKYFEEKGILIGNGGYVAEGVKLENLSDEISDQINQSNPDVITAVSIEELANKMGIDYKNLKTTIDDYNAYAVSGVDKEFDKDPKYLIPIVESPFFALKITPSQYTTLGGLKVNEKLEVLNTEGQVIPALYAVGCNAGGLYGDTYDVAIGAGSQLGFAITGARMAIGSASEYISSL